MNLFITKQLTTPEAEVGEGASGSTESQADQLNESITPTEEGRPLLDRVCEVVQLAGKEL